MSRTKKQKRSSVHRDFSMIAHHEAGVNPISKKNMTFIIFGDIKSLVFGGCVIERGKFGASDSRTVLASKV